MTSVASRLLTTGAILADLQGPLTAGSISDALWTDEEQQVQCGSLISDTRSIRCDGAVIIQANCNQDVGGNNELVIVVDPVAIDRKISIRKINDQMEGRTSPSNTFISHW